MQEFERKEQHNAKVKGFIYLFSAIGVIILCITAVILGYAVSFSSGGEVRDGLGRMLDEVPGALSIILPQWSGHIWLIIDCLVLLGMIMLIDRLFAKSRLYFKGVRNVDF
jgi:hypothetical protein